MNKNQFLEHTVSFLEPYTTLLVFKKTKYGFSSIIDDGWIRIYFTFYQFAGTDNFNVSLDIRKNTVQEIYSKYVYISDSDRKNTSTISFALTKLLRQKEKYFSFSTQTELDTLLKEKILPFILNTVPVLTDRYSRLDNIYSLITEDREEYHDQIWPNFDNYIIALIIGWLIYPADFEAVVTRCNGLFLDLKRKFPDSESIELYDRDFNKIVSDLRKGLKNNFDPHSAPNSA